MSKRVIIDLDSVGLEGIIGYDFLACEDNIILISTEEPIRVQLDVALKLKECKANIQYLEFSDDKKKSEFLVAMNNNSYMCAMNILVTNDTYEDTYNLRVMKDNLFSLSAEMRTKAKCDSDKIQEIYESVIASNNKLINITDFPNLREANKLTV